MCQRHNLLPSMTLSLRSCRRISCDFVLPTTLEICPIAQRDARALRARTNLPINIRPRRCAYEADVGTRRQPVRRSWLSIESKPARQVRAFMQNSEAAYQALGTPTSQAHYSLRCRLSDCRCRFAWPQPAGLLCGTSFQSTPPRGGEWASPPRG